MRRSPGFTAVTVLSLALGIGANVSIFSLFYTVMLRPLPVSHPEQLVELTRVGPGEPIFDGYWGWDFYEQFRDHSGAIASLTGMGFDNLARIRAEGGESERLVLETVPGNYFRMLGLRPALGRLLEPADVPPRGEGDAVVVSWWYWKNRLHGDPGVIGERVYYEDVPKTIVGVAPRAYFGPRVGMRTDFWEPVEHNGVFMLARLRAGVTPRRAEDELTALFRAAAERLPGRRGDAARRIVLEPAGAGLTRIRDQYGKALTLLVLVVGVLLLLACLNMASMLLARSAGRRRELAMRVSLGASRGRLLRQMLTEAMILSAAGTVVGITPAYLGTNALVRIIASGRVFERLNIQVVPDLRLVLFTAGIAVMTGLLFGSAPGWYAFRRAPASALRQAGGGGETLWWRLFGKGLVTAQVALSILLVTAAMMFLGHVQRLRTTGLGFRSDHVLLLVLDREKSGYTRDQAAGRYRELLGRLESIPGVGSASISGCSPLRGCGMGGRFMSTEEHVEPPDTGRRTAVNWVSPRYFETLGIAMAQGRDFEFRDVGRPKVAIVTERMARLFFPSGEVIGKHVKVVPDARFGEHDGEQSYEIVGVVGDAKGGQLRDPDMPGVYFHMFQGGHLTDEFELRTSGDPEAVAGTVQRVARETVGTIHVERTLTLAEQVDGALVPERLVATLASYFGVLAAALAGIGLFGLLAYTVARRTNEIGVRMALGATQGNVVGMVLRDAAGMVAAGLSGGALLVLWGRPLASRLVEDLKPEVVAPVIWAAVVLALVALAAAFVPARRASRVDPVAALRHE